MERSTPVQMRKTLEVVDLYRKSGIIFVPVPCKDTEEHDALVHVACSKLNEIIAEAEK